MNDPGEYSYGAELVGYFFRREGYVAAAETLLRDQDVTAKNWYAISLTERIDDLLMWRLYGEQCRGVCIELSWQYQHDHGFKYALVPCVYGPHASERLLKTTLDLLQAFGLGTAAEDSRIVANCLELLSCMIKHEDYGVEEEVRILVQPTLQSTVCHYWSGASLRPFVLPPLELQVHRVILGAQHPALGNLSGVQEWLRPRLSAKGFNVEGSGQSRFRP
jgi:hypothetical protein